jgi:sec-independent protein translocase protein TatA
MPFKLGPLEIILVLVIILVLFGVGKLPQVGSALGKSLRAFKEGQTDEEKEEVKPRRRARKRAAARPNAAEKPASMS